LKALHDNASNKLKLIMAAEHRNWTLPLLLHNYCTFLLFVHDRPCLDQITTKISKE